MEKDNKVNKIIELEKNYAKLVKTNEAMAKREKEYEDKIIKLQKELDKQKVFNDQNKLEFSPEEIQKMMEEKAKMSDEIDNLKTQIKSIEQEKSGLNSKFNVSFITENNQNISQNQNLVILKEKLKVLL